ncbi:MAG: YafY family protein [Phycisphaerales bacterium]
MKSSRISRVMQILTTLQTGKSYAVSDLSKMFGTSRRTIFRDLKELQAIGVPYHYDAKTGGYTMEPDFFLPPVDLNLQEALSLLMLAHKARNQIQLPFENSALLAALKIENNLPSDIRQYCNRVLQNISARAGVRTPVGHTDIDKTFAQLQKAIAKKRKVNFRYLSLPDRTIIDVELCPYHLLYNNPAWYVLGHSSVHGKVYTFELNHIRDLKTKDECFVGGEDFDVYKYFGSAWSMKPEGQIYNVKLHFLPKAAEDVTEIQWHKSQKITHNDDGSAIVEFRVDGLGEITWWILGYGDQVQVLAPKVLREKVAGIAENVIKINQQR